MILDLKREALEIEGVVGQDSLAPCKYKTLVDFCTTEIPKNDEGFRVVKAEV